MRMLRAVDSRITTADVAPRFRPFTIRDLRLIPQLARLSRSIRREIETVARVLPFRANNFVVDELIDWSRAPIVS